MKYFLDSAILEDILYAYDNWGIDGVTTNPKHIRTSGKPFLTVLNELHHAFLGVNFPISVEINPHLSESGLMYREALAIHNISPNFIIKIPCTNEGLIAAKALEEEGVSTNLTLVFSPSQAIQAGRIKARYVSPFIGWKEANGENCSAYIENIVKIYKLYHFNTEIIVAALRNGSQIVDAALAGADIVTCGFQVYKDSFYHPYTDYGLKVFKDAWDGTAKEEQG